MTSVSPNPEVIGTSRLSHDRDSPELERDDDRG
jgi:hypothetical protein